MQNFNIINAEYFGPTQTKPGRIKVRSARFRQTVFVSIDEWETAADYLKSIGFNIVGTGYDDKTVVLVTDTFKPLK